MKINEKLYELRKQAHLSQEEVAEKLRVTRQTISKWETGESSPDIDKIMPICELYHIDTEELFKGIKKEHIEEEKKENKQKTAFVIALSVFLYFLSIIWIILAETQTNINDEIIVAIFLFICAIPTCYLIYYFVSLPEKEKEENKVLKKIKDILSLITLIIYLVISFTTMKWGITWIIWIIYAVVEEIIETIFVIKEEKNENF